MKSDADKKVNEYCEFVFDGWDESLTGKLCNYKNVGIILAEPVKEETMRLGS